MSPLDRAERRWVIVCDRSGIVTASRNHERPDPLVRGGPLSDAFDLTHEIAEQACAWWSAILRGDATTAQLVPVRMIDPTSGEPTCELAAAHATVIGEQIVVDLTFRPPAPPQDRRRAGGPEVIAASSDGTIRWVTPGLMAATGWQTPDVVGRPWTDFVAVEDHGRVLAAVGALFHRPTGSSTPWAARLVTSTGGTIPHQGAITNLIGVDPVNAIVASCVEVVSTPDVHPQKRHEPQERPSAVLELLDRSSAAVLLIRWPDRVLWANQAFLSMIGATVADLRTDGFLAALSADEASRVAARDAFAQAWKRPWVPITFRVTLRRLDGGDIVVDGTVTNLVDDPSVGAFVYSMRDVTDQVVAERAAIAAVHRQAALLDASHDAVIAWDRTGQVLWANRALYEMTGRPPSELCHANDVLAMVPGPVSRSDIARAWKSARAHPGKAQHARLNLVDARGRWLSIDAAITDMRHDPDVGAYIANLRNVSTEVHAASVVAQTEDRWKALLASATEVLIVFDVDAEQRPERSTTVKYVSDSIRTLTGLTVEEFVADPVSTVFRADLAGLIEHVIGHGSGPPATPVAFRMKHVQLGWRWVEARIRDLRTDPTVRGYVANVRDVTDVIEAVREVSESTARYESVIATLAEGVLVTDAMGLVTEINEAALRMHGVTRDEVIGTRFAEGVCTLIDGATGEPMTFPNTPGSLALLTGQPSIGVELTVLRKRDGRRRRIRQNSSPFRDPITGERRVTITIVDITAEDDRARALEAYMARTSGENHDLQQAVAIRGSRVDRHVRRVAMDLRDHAMDALDAASRRIAELQRAERTEVTTALPAIGELLARAGDAIERSIESLWAPASGDGLTMAVSRLAQRLLPLCAWDISDPGDRFGPRADVAAPVQELVWRVTREAVRNVAQHSQARSAAVRLGVDGGMVHVVVRDDGVGARPEDVEVAPSLGRVGLIAMRERVHAAGGDFHAGAVGQDPARPGWIVRFSVPLWAPATDTSEP